MKNFLLLLLALHVSTDGIAWALDTQFPITTDTYLDSQSPSGNFGEVNVVKILVNSNTTVARGMIQMPEALAAYEPEEMLAARLRFYVWQDNTKAREIALYPLTRPFVEGVGGSSNTASGATWFTYDGTNAWTTPGGDYDAGFAVTGVKESVLNTNDNDRFFSWDLTALLAEPVARSNLLANGAILIMSGEDSPPASGSDRAPFTSSNDPGTTPEYHPHIAVSLVPRDTRAGLVFLPEGGVRVEVTEFMPYLPHRLERTFDLSPSNDWQTVYTFDGVTSDPNWTDAQPELWTNVFYRVVIDP